MLTHRGFWFLVVNLTFLVIGVFFGALPLILVCLSLLFWFFFSWFAFLIRMRAIVPRIRVDRNLETSRGEAETFWVRQKARVKVTLHYEGINSIPHVLALDRIPMLADLASGSAYTNGGIRDGEPLEIDYEIECLAPGRLRFEGVKLTCTDLQGFFAHSAFLREQRICRILPALAVDPSHPAFFKYHNVLPLMGTHRFSRPGSSSELLDLREYLPGDPPKMIAWKVSARRDRLMTKEFESEVPLRCTLFVDISNSVRLGSAGRTSLVRLVEIAAAIAQANAAERDLTGLCVFDEVRVHAEVRAARGRLHTVRLLNQLTDVADLLPMPDKAWLQQLLPVAYGLVQDVYPERLHQDVNAVPWWLPFWAPHPNYTLPMVPRPVRNWRDRWSNWWRRKTRHSRLNLFWGRWSRFSPYYHRLFRWWKQMSAILSQHYQLGPSGLGRLLEDDEICTQYLARFLNEHQVSYAFPLYDEQGKYLFAAPKKCEVLSSALMRAVLRGKDNELFVLLVDLLEAGPELQRLERSVAVARARHHQVIVILPWPRAAPLPDDCAANTRMPAPDLTLEDLVLFTSRERLRKSYHRVREIFTRLGAVVLCAVLPSTPDQVLQQLTKLRQVQGTHRR